MLSDLFVMLFLIAMVLFIVYHIYIDYRNWSNTGNTFAEGMTPAIPDATSCRGWDCSTEGQFCPKGVPGASHENFLCKDKKWVAVASRPPPTETQTAEETKTSDAPVKDLTQQQVMDRQTQARAGISDPMRPTVPQECRQGCVAPNGPSGNCENIQVGGNLKKKCPYSCPNPTFKRGDTVNCAYDKHCNACEPKKIFEPSAPPNMPGARVGGYCPPGQNCDPNLGQPTMGQPTSSWPGTRINVPGIHHAPGLPPVKQPNFWTQGPFAAGGQFPSGPMPPAFAQKFQQQIMAREIPPPPQGHPLEAPLRQALGGSIQLPMVESPVQPSGAGDTQWIGRPATQGLPQGTSPQGTAGCVPGCNPTCKAFTGCTDEQSCQTKYPGVSVGTWKTEDGKLVTNGGYEDCNPGCANAYKRGCDMAPYSPQKQESQPAAANPVSNALFNEQVMTQVLANKNLIPADINLGQENQGNFIRVGQNFMKDVSHIRNIALPNIDDDDYESLGRVIAKIKTHDKQSDDGPQSMVAKKQLANSVKNILSGTMISNSQVDWETPGQKPNITTTGMYGDNSNSMMGYGDKAKKHHKEKPDGGLCLWKGCEKHIKGKPYDSVWSLY